MAETDNGNSNPPVDIAIESEYFSDNDYSFNQWNFQSDDGNAHGPMIDPNNYFLIGIYHHATIILSQHLKLVNIVLTLFTLMPEALIQISHKLKATLEVFK